LCAALPRSSPGRRALRQPRLYVTHTAVAITER